MTVGLDIYEMHYLLESCLRGSHLRSSTILKYVDDWYSLLSPSQRQCLYDWTLRLVYDGEKAETVEAFKLDGRYWVKSNRCCAEECITKIEKI